MVPPAVLKPNATWVRRRAASGPAVRMRSTWAFMLAALLGAPALQAAEAGWATPGRIGVLVDVPRHNFVYRQGSQLVLGTEQGGRIDLLPPVLSPGVSLGFGLGVGLVAGFVGSVAENAATMTARAAAGPVGASIGDVDLRATVHEQLRLLSAERAAVWVAIDEPFPVPVPAPSPIVEETDPITRRPVRPMPVDARQLLVDRARTSEQEATLFVRVLPLFRGQQGKTYVHTAALLIARDGRLLAEWTQQFMGPEVPDLERAALVRWWAEGRYRRFLAHGLHVGLLPIVEDVLDPPKRSERQKQYEQAAVMRYDESGRGELPLRAQQLRALRMQSSVCALEADTTRVVYHFARPDHTDYLMAAATCPGEQFSAWSEQPLPGVTWAREVDAAGPLVQAKSRP